MVYLFIYSEPARVAHCWTHNQVVESKIISGVFPLLNSAEACEKTSRWLWKEICVSTGLRKPGNACASPTAMI